MWWKRKVGGIAWWEEKGRWNCVIAWWEEKEVELCGGKRKSRRYCVAGREK